MPAPRLIVRVGLFLFACSVATSRGAEITRIWLSHRANDPARVMINWETAKPGPSRVEYQTARDPAEDVAYKVAENADSATLHHVEIAVPHADTVYRYRVSSGDDHSAEHEFRSYPAGELRVAVVADWQGQPNLDAIVAEKPHYLMTAGDNIMFLHGRCGKGVKDCTLPYSDLISHYPKLFATVPFMPVLGNHDREIRPRGPVPPPEPVYDVDATAFRKFFELPDDEWKWKLELPAQDIRFIGLDLNHIQDLGTTWQTSHSYEKDSEQFKWYEQLMTGPKPRWVVTLQNEKSGTMRSKVNGEWHKLFSRGTLAVTGFGYFAERAEVDGFSYYNTSLSGKGAKYKDAKAVFFESENSYLLLTVTKAKLTAELKSLEGKVLDAKTFEPATK